MYFFKRVRKLFCAHMLLNDWNITCFIIEMKKKVFRKQLAFGSQNKVVLQPYIEVLDATHPIAVAVLPQREWNYLAQYFKLFKRTHCMERASSSEKAFFFAMIQVYMDKFATTLKASFIVANPVNIVLLNIILQFLCYLVDHDYTFVDQFPVSATTTTNHSDEHTKCVTKLSDKWTPDFLCKIYYQRACNEMQGTLY